MISPCRIEISEDIQDDRWDSFVEKIPGVSFEQTSGWAGAKRGAGWEPLRIVALHEDRILGGSQILVKQLPFGFRVGYVPRGPVCENEREDVLIPMLAALKEVCKVSHLSCLVVQPANKRGLVEDSLIRSGFHRDTTFSIIRATAWIDLSLEEGEIFSRIDKSYRQNIHIAERKRVKVREGDKRDITPFFRLMFETCKRQKVSPNPSHEDFFHQLWASFVPRAHSRLFLAEYEGEVLSGIFAIPLGGVFKIWKIGWSGKHSDVKPNHLLHWEVMKLAKREGYERLDFVGIDRKVAEMILQGRPFKEVASGSAFFKLAFGGKVELLPDCYTYLDNTFARWAYRRWAPRLKGLYRASSKWISG
jgi:peptidoglycan pentaglycine glycine transferase (the first glycine)